MKRLISLVAMISIGGMLLIGCGNTNSDTKKDDTVSASTTNDSNSNKEEYTISSTETNNGKKVKEEEGTVLVNKEGIKTKVADSKGNKVDKDLDTKLRKICEELSGVCGSKDLEAYPINGVLYLNLMGDISSITQHRQQIIDYLKNNPTDGYTQNVTIGSRTESGGENFNIK